MSLLEGGKCSIVLQKYPYFFFIILNEMLKKVNAPCLNMTFWPEENLKHRENKREREGIGPISEDIFVLFHKGSKRFVRVLIILSWCDRRKKACFYLYNILIFFVILVSCTHHCLIKDNLVAAWITGRNLHRWRV